MGFRPPSCSRCRGPCTASRAQGRGWRRERQSLHAWERCFRMRGGGEVLRTCSSRPTHRTCSRNTELPRAAAARAPCAKTVAWLCAQSLLCVSIRLRVPLVVGCTQWPGRACCLSAHARLGAALARLITAAPLHAASATQCVPLRRGSADSNRCGGCALAGGAVFFEPSHAKQLLHRHLPRRALNAMVGLMHL